MSRNIENLSATFQLEQQIANLQSQINELEYPNQETDGLSSGINWFTQGNFNTASPSNGISNGVSLVLNNRTFIIGGAKGNGNTPTNEIRGSFDGVVWTLLGTTAFSARRDFAGTIFNGEIYISGGDTRASSTETNLRDVWKSADGITFTQVTPLAEFPARSAHVMLSFNNKLWVIGGSGNTGPLSDVWSSTNGISWTFEGSAPFSPRSFFGGVVKDGQMWIFGGNSGNNKYAVPSTNVLNDLWVSSDGKKWAQLGNLPARALFSYTVYNDAVWIFTGANTTTLTNGVAYTVDGQSWIEPSSTIVGLTARTGAMSVSKNGVMWIMGGFDGTNLLTDVVLSSFDTQSSINTNTLTAENITTTNLTTNSGGGIVMNFTSPNTVGYVPATLNYYEIFETTFNYTDEFLTPMSQPSGTSFARFIKIGRQIMLHLDALQFNMSATATFVIQAFQQIPQRFRPRIGEQVGITPAVLRWQICGLFPLSNRPFFAVIEIDASNSGATKSLIFRPITNTGAYAVPLQYIFSQFPTSTIVSFSGSVISYMSEY